MDRYLYAVHDSGGEHLFADKPGWIVHTVALTEVKTGDYRPWPRFGNIVRLNWAHNGKDGTIPTPDLYSEMARRCAAYVSGSPECNIVIIGNEPGHINERPNGQPITPTMYADCFNQCYAAIKTVAPNAQVVTAPVAPWDASTKYPGNESGDWVIYFRDMLNAISHADAIGLHLYTHGAGVHLITSSARMQPPFQHRRYEFRAYLDFLDEVPDDKGMLPIYATEADQIDPWVDANTGWVQAAYNEIDGHNQTPGTQKIWCLALYRWRGDKWAFDDKKGVQADLRAAVQKGYQSPQPSGQSGGSTVFLPNVGTGSQSTQPPEALPERIIDSRATARGVTIETPQIGPGQAFWRVQEIHWYDEQEADRLGPDHHIMVDVLGEQGQRLVDVLLTVTWPTGSHEITTEAKPGEPYSANYPLSPSRNEFGIRVDRMIPSEVVKGIGMGADTPSGFNAGIHTTTGVVFQRVIMPAAARPVPTPVPPPITGPIATPITLAGVRIRAFPGVTFSILGSVAFGIPMRVTGIAPSGTWYRVDSPFGVGWVSATVVSATNIGNVPVVDDKPTPQPEQPPQGDNWTRSYAFLKKWEGGYQAIENDRGNWTGCKVGVGELKGTNMGVSACSYPNLDIKNLTREQVEQIFLDDYWKASGANTLPWPLCLLVVDTAVLHGVGTAQAWLAEVGPTPYLFVAKRLRSYLKAENWEFWDEAWVLRVCELLEQMAK